MAETCSAAGCRAFGRSENGRGIFSKTGRTGSLTCLAAFATAVVGSPAWVGGHLTSVHDRVFSSFRPTS